MDKYLKETKMLDYSNENIQQLIWERRWKNINEFERLKSIMILLGMKYCLDIILMIMFLHQRFWQMVMDNVIQKEHCLWQY